MDDSGLEGAPRLGKKPSESGLGGSEVDYKSKSGTAWSHSYLNQKPWHPLSYPNQRRKWIAEQTHANRDRRAQEVAREFAQEQEFFRQTALISKKEKEKVEMMKAVSFMYVRPPGYNAESAKAAEVADEKKTLVQNDTAENPTPATSKTDAIPDMSQPGRNKKARPKDVFGRALPTEEEFEVLKNAPRLETGIAGRPKPFGIEIRNVRCVRCGAFGHQSGDRECPLKDAIMPNEESRLKRDDPLTAIMAQTDLSEPLKWELKQKPGMSPPRGGYCADDPNQQIVAEEIFDEYGGFLSGGDIPDLLTNFSAKKSRRHSKHKSKHKNRSSSSARDEAKDHHGDRSPSSSDSELGKERKRKEERKSKKKKTHQSESSRLDISDSHRHVSQLSSSDSEVDRERRRKAKSKKSSSDSEVGRGRKRNVESKHRKKRIHHSESQRPDISDSGRHGNRFSSSDLGVDRERKRNAKSKYSSSDSEVDRGTKRNAERNHRKRRARRSESRRLDISDSDPYGNRWSCSDSEVDRERKRKAKSKHSSSDSELDMERKRNEKSKHRKKRTHRSGSYRLDNSDSGRDGDGLSSSDSGFDKERKRKAKNKHLSSDSEDDKERKRNAKSKNSKKRTSSSASSADNSSDSDRHRKCLSSSSDSEVDRERKKRGRNKHRKKRSCHSDSGASDSAHSDRRSRRRRKRHCVN